MIVSVVSVGEVGVGVLHRFMAMPVDMLLAFQGRSWLTGMFVHVVLVVRVFMLVLHRVMDVDMAVAFRQM